MALTKKLNSTSYLARRKISLTRLCQLIFHLSLVTILYAAILPVINFHMGYGNIYAYDSSLIESKKSKENLMYYNKHLKYLRRSVKPRFIHLLDTENYKTSSTIHKAGVLFTYKNYHAKEVYFISSMDRYRKHPMRRNDRGVWYYILPRPENNTDIVGKEIRYKFVVDGLFVHDSTHNQYEDDNAGGFISLYYLNKDYVKAREGVLVLNKDTYDNKKVMFRLNAPNAQYVSLIGSFNNWDSSVDRMKKNSNGYFELSKSLPHGEYIYLYRVDENIQLDKKSTQLKFHPVFGRVGYFVVH